MSTEKITYQEIKARQKRDLMSKSSEYYIYRHLSSPFTWIFVKLGIAPNTITISSFFLCLIGFYFLSLGTHLYLISGLVFFIIFKIFDMSDGEVARIKNDRSIEGVYFDRVSHYIFTCCLGIGLGLGLYKLYSNDAYIILCFFFTLAFILEDSINDLLGYPAIGSTVETMKNTKLSALHNNYKSFQKKIKESVFLNDSWEKRNILSKLFGIIPFQGILYSESFITPLLIFFTIIEAYVQNFINLPAAYQNMLKIITAYILTVTISKTIWIFYFISRMRKNRYITSASNKL